MRRFIFSLQQVLDLRVWEEREKEVALGKVLGERVNLERQIEDRLKREKDVFLNRSEGFDMRLLSEIEQFGLRMRSERKELSLRLEEKRREEEDARKRFLEVSRKRKVLDKLKERKEESYRKSALRDEQKAQDELGGNRFFLDEEASSV